MEVNKGNQLSSGIALQDIVFPRHLFHNSLPMVILGMRIPGRLQLSQPLCNSVPPETAAELDRKCFQSDHKHELCYSSGSIH